MHRNEAMDQRSLEEKYGCLKDVLQALESVLVAFSGGVDSTFLLKVAHDVLGDKAVGVTATSESYPTQELEEAKRLAAFIGVRHVVIETEELLDPRYTENPTNRCYYCKTELFRRLSPLAEALGLRSIVDGANIDDLNDHRPGRWAAQEYRVRSPLVEAGFGKEEIRLLSQRLGLPTWEKPASPCLSSRFPYGVEITPEQLRMVEAAEAFLRSLGFHQVRVRHHERLARIEVPREELPRLVTSGLAEKIAFHLKALGYLYVTVDLEGYRSGSLNAALRESREDGEDPGHR